MQIDNTEAPDDKIVIRSVYGRVSQKYTIQPCRDSKTGRYPDHVKKVDSNGDMILTDEERKAQYCVTAGECLGLPFIPETYSITFESGKVFDLTDTWQRAEWLAIKNCSMIAKTIDQRDAQGNLLLSNRPGAPYSATELFIERPTAIMNKRVTRREMIHNAESYIFNDEAGADGRLKIARLLGRSLRNAPDADVKDFLLDIAAKTPEKIINLYTGEDLSLRVLFMDALDKHVIYSKNRVYLYADGIALGGTVDATIAWMRDPRNKTVLDLIKRDTYKDQLEVTNPDAIKAINAENAAKEEKEAELKRKAKEKLTAK